MFESQNRPRPIAIVTEKDFHEIPLWEWFCSELDDEAEESELDGDETFVVALPHKKIPKLTGSYIVASTITLANGAELSGALEVCMREARLEGWMPLTMFWKGADLGSFEPYPKTIKYLESAMQLAETEIYPLTWKSNVPLEDSDIIVGGSVSKNNEIGAHPDPNIMSATPF